MAAFSAVRRLLLHPTRRKIFADGKLWLSRQETHFQTTAHRSSLLRRTAPLLSGVNLSVGKPDSCLCCQSAQLHSSQLSSNQEAAGGEGQSRLWKRQSPIHILSANAITSEELRPLDFNKGWSEPMSGTYDNLGYTVTFRPGASSESTLKTHVGEYSFVNFHYHWGKGSGCGSEHLVDNKQYELEIHFVFKKMNDTKADAGDAMAVVGVFGEMDSGAEVKGMWEKIDPTKVPVSGSVEEVGGVIYSELLPKKQDFFYYEGSLTTPAYDEVVQWFVLREPIKVPALYFEQLRSIQNAKGNKIINNFRELQDLNSRTVKKLTLQNEKEPITL